MNFYFIPTILLLVFLSISCSTKNYFGLKEKNNTAEFSEQRPKCPANKIPVETTRIANNKYYPGLNIKLLKVSSSCKYIINAANKKKELFLDFAFYLSSQKNKKFERNSLKNLMLYVAIIDNNDILAKVLIPVENYNLIQENKNSRILEVKSKFKFSKFNSVNDLDIYYGIQVSSPQLTKNKVEFHL